MGRRRESGRRIDGILLLDKPVGVGSNEALQRVKRLFRARKAGHTGSLDRLASGLLPLCFGEATKMSGYLLNADKCYESTFRLGVTTTTGDAEGEVVDTRPVGPLDAARVEAALARFRGTIEQVPPMFSAIKVKGQRLYKLAHQGMTVERDARTVTIHALELRGIGEDRISVFVRCSKGTYVRTLAEDVGEALGCGASVVELRRTGAGPFSGDAMHPLEEVERLAEEGTDALDALLLPLEAAVADWPRVDLAEGLVFYVRQGQPVLVPHAPTEGWVQLFARGERFMGVGEVLDDGRIAPRRLLGR